MATPNLEVTMQIDKETVMSLLREQGKTSEANDAERELPDQVDTERDAGLLERFGVNPQDLIGRVTGGGGIPGL
jgi:hypothetical protein